MATYSIQDIYDAALEAGFSQQQAATWTAIALAESGGRTSALNNRGEHSVGLWQINIDPEVRGNSWGDLSDPGVNAKAAFEVSRHGRDMRPWTTTHDSNKGTARDYRTYLDDVEATVGVKGDWRGVHGYRSPLLPALADEGGVPRPLRRTAAYDMVTEAPPPEQQTDSDSDGLVDEFEQFAGTRVDLADSDSDGLPDGFEIANGHSNPLSADGDRDGLADPLEVSLGTSAVRMDSDDDGLTDRVEVELGSDPLVPDAGTGEAPATPVAVTSTTQPGLAPATQPGLTPSTQPASFTTASLTAAGVRADGKTMSPAASESLADRFVAKATDQRGDPYIYGAETRLADDDPDAFDCSELTQWAAHQVGVTIPDGAEWQYLDLKNKRALIPVEEALKTKGALLFYFSHEPSNSGARPERAHVAISMGDGRTIEARGRAYGVNEFAAKHRFNYAGLIPGLGDAAPPPLPEPPPRPPRYDAIMAGLSPDQARDADGDGLVDAFERLAGTRLDSADTDADGLPDAVEAMSTHTDPLSADTDQDGVPDPLEVAMGTDAGRLPGVAGVSGQGILAMNVRNPVPDTDGDGLNDVVERRLHLDPRLVDTDLDTLPDALELALGTSGTLVDTDLDGLSDALEIQLASDPLQVPSADLDGGA